MKIRECEVILDVTSDYDGTEIEVTCGRMAIAKIHDWWMCADCRAEELQAAPRPAVARSRQPPAIATNDDVSPKSTTRVIRGAA